MKCPKCNYLGFETGDRCKNCGYDFSLLTVAAFQPAEYEVHPASIDDVPIHVVNDSADVIDAGLTFRTADHLPPIDTPLTIETPAMVDDVTAMSQVLRVAQPAAEARTDSALPLFAPKHPDDDEPLIKLPVAPRAPLAVRRTPDTPRLRAVPRPVNRPAPMPSAVLEFPEEDRSTPISSPQSTATDRTAERQPSPAAAQPIRAASRVIALAVDYLILLGIDAAVVYFTVRMAGLATEEWRLLPVVPMLAFLVLLKVAYFYAFTAVGGQTIGKMAVGTCVVTDDGKPLDAGHAMRRTCAGALSFVLFGVGFVPALFGDRRALHDRLSGTRVIRLRSV